MPLPRLHTLLLLAALTGCATQPASVFDPPAPARVAIVPLVTTPQPPLVNPLAHSPRAAETRAVVAAAEQQQRVAQQKVPGYQDRERLLAQAQQAAREGNNPRAQSLARQAQGRASAAVVAQQTREAAALLKALYDTTGLSDAQLASLRAAETQLVRGENSSALQKLRGIKAVAEKPRPYRIRRGDTLSAIAARENVYGNSLLWPLLWEANKDTIPDPNRLRAGATLKIRPSPSVEQVVQAIQTARQYPSRVRIGKVKTLPKK